MEYGDSPFRHSYLAVAITAPFPVVLDPTAKKKVFRHPSRNIA